MKGAFERSGNSTLSADAAAEGLGEREGFTFNLKSTRSRTPASSGAVLEQVRFMAVTIEPYPHFRHCGPQDLPRPDAGWAPVIVGICSVLTCNPVIAIPALAIARQRDRE